MESDITVRSSDTWIYTSTVATPKAGTEESTRNGQGKRWDASRKFCHYHILHKKGRRLHVSQTRMTSDVRVEAALWMAQQEKQRGAQNVPATFP
jgi:hypothetical protein